MEKVKRLIATEQDRQRIIAELSALPLDAIKVVVFGDAERSLQQNAKFHAVCSDVSKQVLWDGGDYDTKGWKLLFVSGHAMATGGEVKLVHGFEDELVNIRESTADMGVRRMSSCLEYQAAWCADNGIRLHVPKWMEGVR